LAALVALTAAALATSYPSKTNDAEKAAIRQRLEAGDTVSAVARDHGISRATVIAIWDTVTA
jgi:transposase-like protein